MIKFLLVFLGGGAGSLLRYGLALWLGPVQGRFPWATLAANALACFILGWVGALALQHRLSEEQRLLLATGLCGGMPTRLSCRTCGMIVGSMQSDLGDFPRQQNAHPRHCG